MTKDQEIMIVKGRIALLEAKGVQNLRIVNKLKRRLRKLQSM